VFLTTLYKRILQSQKLVNNAQNKTKSNVSDKLNTAPSILQIRCRIRAPLMIPLFLNATKSSLNQLCYSNQPCYSSSKRRCQVLSYPIKIRSRCKLHSSRANTSTIMVPKIVSHLLLSFHNFIQFNICHPFPVVFLHAYRAATPTHMPILRRFCCQGSICNNSDCCCSVCCSSICARSTARLSFVLLCAEVRAGKASHRSHHVV
jgi:hypothetical protein